MNLWLDYWSMQMEYPSLQGTLAKHTNLTLQPNFTKEPFSPSRSIAGLRDSAKLTDKLIDDRNCQCHGILKHYAESGIYTKS